VKTTADNVRTAAKTYREGDEAEAEPFKKQAGSEVDAKQLRVGTVERNGA
jgi:hypothetical protein